jgi:lipoprotein
MNKLYRTVILMIVVFSLAACGEKIKDTIESAEDAVTDTVYDVKESAADALDIFGSTGPYYMRYKDGKDVLCNSNKEVVSGWIAITGKDINGNVKTFAKAKYKDGVFDGGLIVYDEDGSERIVTRGSNSERNEDYYVYFNGKITINIKNDETMRNGEYKCTFRIIPSNLFDLLSKYATHSVEVSAIDDEIFNSIYNMSYKSKDKKIEIINGQLAETFISYEEADVHIKYDIISIRPAGSPVMSLRTVIYKKGKEKTNPELKPGTVIREAIWSDETEETVLTQYDFDRKAFVYRDLEVDGFDEFAYVGNPDWKALELDEYTSTEGGVLFSIDAYHDALYALAFAPDPRDGVCRVFAVTGEASGENGRVGEVAISIHDREIEKALIESKLREYYPEYKFDFKEYYNGIPAEGSREANE